MSKIIRVWSKLKLSDYIKLMLGEYEKIKHDIPCDIQEIVRLNIILSKLGVINHNYQKRVPKFDKYPCPVTIQEFEKELNIDESYSYRYFSLSMLESLTPEMLNEHDKDILYKSILFQERFDARISLEPKLFSFDEAYIEKITYENSKKLKNYDFSDLVTLLSNEFKKDVVINEDSIDLNFFNKVRDLHVLVKDDKGYEYKLLQVIYFNSIISKMLEFYIEYGKYYKSI